MKFLLSFLLLMTPTAPTDEFEITADVLARVSAEAVEIFEKHSGEKFVARPRFELATQEELATILADELAEQLRSISQARGEKNEADVVEQATLSAEMLSQALLAKYQLSKHRILVSAEGFAKLAKLLDEPKLRSEPALFGVLVHELVHARDAERSSVFRRLKAVRSADEMLALSCLLEGHAQHRARQICKAAERSTGFEIFDRCITKPDPNLEDAEEGERLLANLVTQIVSTPYREGEAFFDRLVELGGAAALEKALQDPPKTMLEIFRPDWYLDPSSRPAEPPFGRAFDIFARDYQTGWDRQEVPLVPSQLRPAMEPLEDPAAVDKMFEGIRTMRCVVLTKGMGDSLVTLLVYHCETSPAAETVVALSRRLGVAKDEKMKAGAIRILSAEYEEIRGQGWRGFQTRKKVQVGPEEVDVVGGVVALGDLAIEYLYSNTPITETRVREVLDAATAALVAPTKEAVDPEPKKEPKDGPAGDPPSSKEELDRLDGSALLRAVEQLPNEIQVRHDPAVVHGPHRSNDPWPFHWDFATEVTVPEPVEIIEVIIAAWDGDDWILPADQSRYNCGRVGDRFAEWYGASDRQLRPDRPARDSRNWAGSPVREEFRQKWIFVGRKSGGSLVRGEAVVELRLRD